MKMTPLEEAKSRKSEAAREIAAGQEMVAQAQAKYQRATRDIARLTRHVRLVRSAETATRERTLSVVR